MPNPFSLSALLRPRPADGHKGTFGHGLLIAGKYGMAGAAVLASRAALRSGLGKVTAYVPQRLLDVLQVSVPEAIVLCTDDAPTHFAVATAVTAYDAVAIGPGIGTDASTAAALAEQLLRIGTDHKPLVLDADALNLIAQHPSLLSSVPESAILTPHRGEFARLLSADGVEAADEAAVQRAAFDFAQRHRVILVLKGHPTRIYAPQIAGTAVGICPWGGSGMATAGSGDVLTGVLLGLLAQGYAPYDAARLGVGLHALAGDAATADLGAHSVMASDIIAHLPDAFRSLTV